MKSKLFISCDEASSHIDKAQYGEASFYEKLTYKIHIIYCKFCRNYASKSKKLTQLLKSNAIHFLSPSKKTKMKEVLEKEKLKL